MRLIILVTVAAALIVLVLGALLDRAEARIAKRAKADEFDRWLVQLLEEEAGR